MLAREDSENSKGLAQTQPEDIPAWVTKELIEKTIEVWQPQYSDPLTAEDATYIILNVGRLFDLLTRSTGE